MKEYRMEREMFTNGRLTLTKTDKRPELNETLVLHAHENLNSYKINPKYFAATFIASGICFSQNSRNERGLV